MENRLAHIALNIQTMKVCYFYGQAFKDTMNYYEHQQEFPFDKRKRTVIIDFFLERGYNVMLQQVRANNESKEKTILLIWVDQFRFQQR